MELIPILSFIILVATISTFILAIGAYILYKMRERKGRTSVMPAPRYIEAELYTPNQAVIQQGSPMMQGIPQMQGGQVSFQDPYQQQRTGTEARPQMPPQAVPAPRTAAAAAQQARQRQQDYPQSASEGEAGGENPTNKKFMKYTTEGYVPVSQTKTGENLKWR